MNMQIFSAIINAYALPRVTGGHVASWTLRCILSSYETACEVVTGEIVVIVTLTVSHAAVYWSLM